MNHQTDGQKKSALPKRKSKFVNDKHFGNYAKPKMVDVAQEMLCTDNLTEEGFLGAQAVLLINGIL